MRQAKSKSIRASRDTKIIQVGVRGVHRIHTTVWLDPTTRRQVEADCERFNCSMGVVASVALQAFYESLEPMRVRTRTRNTKLRLVANG
jgi:hypothetical protein